MDPVDEAAPAGGPTDYPAAFETDVVLSDGGTAHVRPIRPDDGERILEFHARQSPQSIYYRYFSPRPRLSERDVERLTTLDYVDRMALIALHGDQLIGVARYDRWRHRSEAEVAFFIDDAHQGRGLATVLLEHLAVRAREVGISGFTASVLPENRKMIGVFTAAGFQAATRFEDGVVEVRLGLLPTPEAEAAIEQRARSAAQQAVRRLLSPRSVAVIGASRTPGTIGHDLFRNLQRAGFEGPLYPVNPQAEHVGSVRAVPSILDIVDDVDLAVVVVPAEAVPAVVEECGRKQVYGVVVLSSGFAEVGEEGAALEAEVLRTARAWGIRLVGPNCLGIINTSPDVALHATFAQAVPLPGRVSLLSESGMVGAAIVAQARTVGLGISSFVALGNRADVSGNDLLQYWETDDDTDVVCMYIESFGNARHFSRLARRLSRAKPVVAVKAARSAGTTESALLRQTGVLHVPTLAAMLETTRLLTSQPLPRDRRVAVLGNAGGSLAIAADAVQLAGLELAQLSPTSSLSNPHDLGLRATAEDFAVATEALVSDPAVDAVVAIYAPSLGSNPAETRQALAQGRQAKAEVPLAACFFGPDHGSDVDEAVDIPVYGSVDAAAAALGRVAEYAEWLSNPEGDPVVLDEAMTERVRSSVVADLSRDEADVSRDEVDLPRSHAAELLAAVGATVVDSREVTTVDEARRAAGELGYPVVLKGARRDRMAKTVAGGFALDLADEGAVTTAWARMSEALGEGLSPALVQTMVDPGVDVAVEVSDHPEVGPFVSIRPGGAGAILDRGGDVRVLPLGEREVRRLIERSRLATVLPPADRQALADLLLKLGALVEAVPEISWLCLNPVIVRAGQAVITDIELRLTPLDRDPLPPLRRV